MESLDVLILFFVALFVSISLHEMMHAFVAYRLGDDLAHSQGRISLNPLAHIDPVLTLALPLTLVAFGLPPILAAKPVPINTSRIRGEELGMAAVGVAGPLTNLLLAFVFAFSLSVLGATGLVRDFFELAVQINIGLFVFNMLPIPPLDGSRLLYAVAPEPLQRVMAQIEGFGIMGLVIFLLVLGPVIAPILTTSSDFILQLMQF